MKLQSSGINTVVLAGGVNSIVLFDGYVPGYKALLPVRSKPLINYTLQALTGTSAVKRICIVGPVAEIQGAVQRLDRYEYTAGGETLIENIERGLRFFHDSEAVLVMPSDLPLVTPEAIAYFLDACAAIERHDRAEIFWSMVPEECFTGQYELVKQKGLNRFRDVAVCHGNLLLITTRLLRNRAFAARMEAIYHARKSTIRAALAVGLLTGFGYLVGVHLLGILSLSGFARLASAGFGVDLVPVICPYPEIAADIDEARDYRFAIEELDRRERSQEKTGRLIPRGGNRHDGERSCGQ